MWRDAWLVAGKDLRLELRSRVALNQVVPFALLVLVLFAFALDPDRGLLERATPGLYWVAVLYTTTFTGWPLLLATVGVATAGIAAAGTLYGVLAAGLRVGETLLPLLLLPVLAPVLIGSTRAFEAALAGAPADGWPWVGLMAVFAVLYIVAGVLGFGPLLEES